MSVERLKNFLKNEAKFMLWSAGAFVAVAIIAAILIPVLSRHLAIDRCLDAGGSYDYTTGKCIGVDSK
jgi:hypothetical protein